MSKVNAAATALFTALTVNTPAEAAPQPVPQGNTYTVTPLKDVANPPLTNGYSYHYNKIVFGAAVLGTKAPVECIADKYALQFCETEGQDVSLRPAPVIQNQVNAFKAVELKDVSVGPKNFFSNLTKIQFGNAVIGERSSTCLAVGDKIKVCASVSDDQRTLQLGGLD